MAFNTVNTFGTPTNGATYAAGNAITGGGTVLQYSTAASFNHTGLTANTHYYYKIWSYDGSTYSLGSTANAITPCSITAAPWTENFEAATFPPSCWSTVAGTGSWARVTTASGFGTGTASAEADFYNINGTVPFSLITLPFSNGTLASPTLSFDWAYATYATEVDEMDIYYSTNNGSSYTLLLAMPGGPSGILNTAGVSTAAFVPTAAQWATKTIVLPIGTNMVKFNAISAYGNNLYLDNVKIVEGNVHDVGVASIDAPGTTIISGTIVTPKATVKNYGTYTETFDVTLTAW